MDSQFATLFSSQLLPTPAQKDQLLQLLRSNSAPPTESYLRSIIASSPADVARYDEEIEQIQVVLNRLISERDALQEYSHGCGSAFAPVRRLPTEILTEIFALCSPTPILYCDGTQEIPTDVFKRTAQHYLSQLSQVCSSWYRTVMGTPSLWATIEVDLTYDPATPKQIDKYVEHLARSLDRSGLCPLTIQLNAYDTSANPGLELLAQNSERWRVMDMYNDANTSTSLSHAKGNLPLLEYLGLGGSTKDIDIFETAPRLSHVILPDLLGPPPKLPWSQLRDITYHSSRRPILYNGAISDVLTVMSRCSSQCEFNIYNLDISRLTLPISDLVPVDSSIRALRLDILDTKSEEHSRQAVGEILGTLTFHCLRELHIRSSAPDERLFWPRDHFSTFASRSSLRQTLTKLFLYDVVITEKELIECLSQMHALLELFIQDVAGSLDFDRPDHTLITDLLLQKLTWRADSSCLVPKLTNFALASVFFFDEDTFLHFVTSRLVPGHTDDGPLRIQTTGLIGQDLGAPAGARMSELQRRGYLRWFRKDMDDLRCGFSNVHLF
ncbi:hypothetical protein B0H19DRAFT_1035459 [Mycena capillaripes]|nr:hypothetical protein B0H19DRAFT_1035459 [Mycena capillaripes]